MFFLVADELVITNYRSKLLNLSFCPSMMFPEFRYSVNVFRLTEKMSFERFKEL